MPTPRDVSFLEESAVHEPAAAKEISADVRDRMRAVLLDVEFLIKHVESVEVTYFVDNYEHACGSQGRRSRPGYDVRGRPLKPCPAGDPVTYNDVSIP